jgi:proline iminopeptidase
VVLHGGPGLDHTGFRPYLDALGDEFRVLYVDERGQGRSERVDPQTLSLERFARDVDELAAALELEGFALLGHSFGAIVTTWHAIHLGTAAAYVVSGGGDSSDALEADVDASLDALGPEGEEIRASWEAEKHVRTEQEVADLMRAQWPFHFAGDRPPGYGEDTIFTPDVLRHFARNGYGDFDYRPDLVRVSRPTLVVTGELDRTTTVRASRVLYEGIRDSRLHIVGGAGHMTFVEAPEEYLGVVRSFLRESLGSAGNDA